MSTTHLVLIHGMWSTPDIWDNFRSFYQQQGYTVHCPSLRHHNNNQDLSQLAVTSVRDYIDDLSEFIESLPEKPVLVGHSMGGLLALILAGKGLSKATILLTPAAPAGILSLHISVVRTFASVLFRWGFWRKAMKLNRKATYYGVLNALPSEQKTQWYDMMIFESGRAAAEIAFPQFDQHNSTQVDQDSIQNPLLVMAGEYDRITPAATCREIAARYNGDFQLFHGRAHMLPVESEWQKVAQQTVCWLQLQGVK